MARSIIGDTAAASGKPAPRRIRLPVPRKPAGDPAPSSLSDDSLAEGTPGRFECCCALCSSQSVMPYPRDAEFGYFLPEGGAA